MKSIILHFKNQYNIQRIFFFSDNCASQFKSKYCVSNLCQMEKDFGVKAEWNFFAASHGKGTVDGIGGAIKGAAWRAVKSKQVIINSAKDFYNFSCRHSTVVSILWVSSFPLKILIIAEVF